MENKRKTS